MKVLILVDLEKEWIQKESEYYIGSNLKSFIEKTNDLIDYSREQGYKIIFIKHIEDTGNAFFKNSLGIEFFDNINIKNYDTVIEKHRISPFYKTNLEDELNGYNSIIVSGILTNLCVRSLINDAYDRDFNIELIEDCTISFDKEIHDFTLKDIKQTRPEVDILKLNKLIKK